MSKLRRNFKKTLEIYKKRKKLIVAIILLLSVFFPFYISIKGIITDSIPFWYDPARDLLMAWDNLTKPTLIGPPSGIPGVFYGPHWLWLLSFGLLFSKDPRVVAFLILAIPYFTIFPLLLFRFEKLFGRRIAVLLWLLFIFGYKTYTTYIWSPHLAPLFFLITIYLFVFTNLHEKKLINYLRIFLAGISTGLLINVHISFGVAITSASMLFLIIEFFLTIPKKKWRDLLSERLTIFLSFVFGLLISLLPNIAFEMRHGFNQIKAIIYTVSSAFLYHSTVVGYVGLGKQQIIQEFLNTLGKLLNTTSIMATYIVYASIIIHVVSKRKIYFANMDKLTKKLLLFLSVCIVTMLTVYLNSKNPIWTYHFIGSEIIIILLLGFILTRFSLLRNLLTIWVAYLILTNIYQLIKPSDGSLYKISNLATKKYIADLIYKDTQKEPFAVFAYSTAIYTYDYDYIFRWFGQDKYPNQFPKEAKEVKYIYLIIPRIEEAYKVDFINYKTPKDRYKTVSEWRIPDGTTILKREKLS